MVIESRTIVGGAAALAIVGAGLWISATLWDGSDAGVHVDVQQINEPSWAVEVKELGSVDIQKTAAR